MSVLKWPWTFAPIINSIKKSWNLIYYKRRFQKYTYFRVNSEIKHWKKIINHHQTSPNDITKRFKQSKSKIWNLEVTKGCVCSLTLFWYFFRLFVQCRRRSWLKVFFTRSNHYPSSRRTLHLEHCSVWSQKTLRVARSRQMNNEDY